MFQPIVMLPVFINRPLHTWRNTDFAICCNDLPRSLNNPAKNGPACIFKQVICIVFNIRYSFNLGIKRNHDKPAPRPLIHGAHTRQMVSVKHQRMARGIAERVLVFLLGSNFIGGTKLLHIGSAQAHAFLKLSGNQQAFPLGLGELRSNIPPTTNRQGFC